MTPEWELNWDTLTRVLTENGQGCIAVQVNGLERAREFAFRIQKIIENAPHSTTIIEFDSSTNSPQEIVRRVTESTTGWKRDDGVVILISTAPVLVPQRAAFWKNMNFVRETFGAFAFHIVFILSPDEYTVFLTEADHFADWCMLKVDLSVREEMLENAFRSEEPGVDPRQAKIAIENLEQLLLRDSESGVDEKKLIGRYYLPMFFLAVDAQDFKRADILRKKIRDEDVPESMNRKWIMYNIDIDVTLGLHTGIQEKSRIYISDLMKKAGEMLSVEDLTFAGELAQATADYRQAADLYEQAIECHLKNHSTQDPVTNELYHHLGMVYSELGEYTKAIRLYNQALSFFKTAYGEQHSTISRIYNNIGNVYSELGDHQTAITLYEQALEIDKMVYGNTHPYINITYNNLATEFSTTGSYHKAILLFEHILSSDMVVYGEQHPNTAHTYNNMGTLYSQLGEHQKAIILFEKALKIYVKANGYQHPNVARTFNNLGLTYKYLHDHQKAIIMYAKASGIYIAAFGEQHPCVAKVYKNFASVYFELGEYSKVIAYLEKSFVIFENFYGTDHPDTRIVRKAIESFRKNQLL